MTVLIVDDDPGIREIVHRLLVRDFGVQVLEAGDGLKALQHLLVGRVDLVILDLAMRGLGGLETLEAIRRSPACATLPVAVLSGLTDQRSVVRASQLGVLAFLAKPFTIADLRQRLAALIARVQPADVATRSGKAPLELSPAQRVLIVDQQAEFREFLRDRLRETCQVEEAQDEATAARRCVEGTFAAVFIGTTTDPVRIPALRETLTRLGRHSLPRMIAVAPSADLQATREQGDCDDVVVRSFVVETFDRSLRLIVGETTRARLLFSACAPGATALFDFAGEKVQALLRKPVTLEALAPFPDTVDRWVSAGVELHAGGLSWEVRARCPFAAALDLSAAWLQLESDQVSEAQVLEVAGMLVTELANVLCEHGREREVRTSASVPRVALTRAEALARSEIDRPGAGRWFRTARHHPTLVVQLATTGARP